MPTPYIKKLSKEGKGSVPSLEKKWDEAKEAAGKQGHAKDYGYVTNIFKKMSHASIQAKERLLATRYRLKAERETGLGAGTTFMARDTGRFLFLKRSDQGDEPGTWCNCGGGVEAGETPEQGARREAIEEIGYSEPYDFIPMDVNTQPDGFTYHNFFSVVPTEFEPHLNDEHTDFMWADSMPEPMHPEYEAALLRWHQNHADAT